MASRQSLAVRLLLLFGVTGGSQFAMIAHGQPAPAADAGLPVLPPGTPKGYLPLADLPNSLALLPPPPAPGSPAFAYDQERSNLAETASAARRALATSDADLGFPQAATRFACATGLSISKEVTPALYRLLGRMFIDVGLSTYRAKNRYKRIRPFVMQKEASCTPADEKFLSTDGSYPSGHSAAGWGWALALTEIVPARTDAILARGRDFGESRIVCNVHWQSDVDAGRVIAAATVARLHADPGFAADLAAAKAEASASRPASADAVQACAVEAAALRITP